MGKLIAFPRAGHRTGNPDRGHIHCYRLEGGTFEIGHESRSGDSWGGFRRFILPQDAVAAAYHDARTVYGDCGVLIDPEVIAAYPAGADLPPPNWGDF